MLKNFLIVNGCLNCPPLCVRHCNTLIRSSHSQLTAYSWVLAKRLAGWLVDWLVGGKSCLSRVSLSVRATFAHISGTGRPINFVFDPREGFSGTADRLHVLSVSPNLRWRLLMTSSRNNRCRNFGDRHILLQCVSIACYAEPCISYGRDVSPYVCLSARLSHAAWH